MRDYIEPVENARTRQSDEAHGHGTGLAMDWRRDDIAAALENLQFVPYYQPKIDLRSGSMAGVEILARWDHSGFGVLAPDDFLSHVQQFGLDEQLTESIMQQVVKFAQDNASVASDLDFAINFSPITLQGRGMTEKLAGLLARFNVSPRRITVEVTESVAAGDVVGVHKTLEHLRRHGFNIAIDDFGTGYSSMKLLSLMPFTELKIDRSLVTGAHHDPKSAVILQSIIELAHKLQLHTVGEGVERKEDVEFLQHLGCDTGQGYFFDTPMSQEEFIQRLKGRTSVSMAV